ncbi:MAG: glycosyltransferase [Vicinamibacterales bacterium]
MRTTVVVLQDLGRSPRMQAHALALAHGGDVTLIGLEGAPVQAAVAAESRIRSVRLRDRAFRGRTSGGPWRYVGLSAARAALQGVRLGLALMCGPTPDLVLVQNPPAIPTLAAGWAVARLRGARLVIDWQNLSHTLAAVPLGEAHGAVRAIRRGERRWARRADAHLAISRAMADWLLRECGVGAVVFHDAPVSCFKKPALEVASSMWQRLSHELALGARRVPLVVCATSWNPEEDVDLLLESLERAERRLVTQRGPGNPNAPDLALLMTGRGPLRAEFERRVARRALTRVAVRTIWLEPADYPVLVGMADAGVCLHQSSSGRDLPIRLAEFRGCGVPLCVYDYAPVVGEVLTNGKEGVTFREPGELANVLVALATNDLSSVPAFAASREWLVTHPSEPWDEAWRRIAAPVLKATSERAET